MQKRFTLTLQRLQTELNAYSDIETVKVAQEAENLKDLFAMAAAIVPEAGRVEVAWNMPNNKTALGRVYSNGQKSYLVAGKWSEVA